MAPMNKTTATSTKTLPLLHLLNQSRASAVRFEKDLLHLTAKNGSTVETVEATEIREVQLRKLPLLNRLTVLTKQGRTITVNGLDRNSSQALHTTLWARVDELLNEEAAAKARALAPEIAGLQETITSLLTPKHYVRHSQAQEATDAVQRTTEQVDDRTRQKLDPIATDALEWMKATTDPEDIERFRNELNETFLENAAPAVHEATQEMLRNGLTHEQARNIATDEDATLVLAGAGTGKTAVITGKIAHLVRNLRVPPESILALAFNRKAALEIRERLPGDLKDTHVSTFHSFALGVVASQGTAPTISKLAQDDFAYSKALDGILARMKTNPKMAERIVRMVSSFSTEYREPFDFTNPAEYEQYVQDAELRTLNGELVKSFEELTVSNFLITNGIRYTYEKPYEFLTATREHRQYQPDFHLTDYDIYIEHFALNEQGQAPPGWTTYTQEAQWKRDLHAQT